MYAFIKGTLVEKGRDRVHVETSGGVGYEIFISQSERDAYPDPGTEVTLHTHLYVREDKQQLFGFLNRPTRDFFRDLLPQKGIGPKLAISILSDLGSEEFRKAVHRQDTDALTKVKGVGKKTAKRLIVEMAEKLPQPDQDQGLTQDPRYDEAVQALRGLGFNKEKAAQAVREALENGNPEQSLEDVISSGLEELERT